MADHCPTPWLGENRGYFIDWLTQRWVQYTGRVVALNETSWLNGPSGPSRRIGADYFEWLATTGGWRVVDDGAVAGLTPDFRQLGGRTFQTDRLDPRVVGFYEQTGHYTLDVWSRWCGLFRPFGWLIAFLFSRRLEQLNLPMSPLQTSRGIRSRIVPLADEHGGRCTGWLRTIAPDHRVFYCGIYDVCKVPGHPDPCVRVIFPLPNGSATVILRPAVRDDGGLELISSGRRFGDPGFYFVVNRTPQTVWARYVPAMRERIQVPVDDEGRLYADHVLTLWGLTFLRLHYRMRRQPGSSR